MFDHLRKNRKKSIFYILRDVAQLVARVLWEHDVAGSNPVIPTKIADSSARKPQSRVALRSFFLINLNTTALFFTIGGKHEQELHLSDFNKKLD